jgi:hypothetical protein
MRLEATLRARESTAKCLARKQIGVALLLLIMCAALIFTTGYHPVGGHFTRDSHHRLADALLLVDAAQRGEDDRVARMLQQGEYAQTHTHTHTRTHTTHTHTTYRHINHTHRYTTHLLCPSKQEQIYLLSTHVMGPVRSWLRRLVDTYLWCRCC